MGKKKLGLVPKLLLAIILGIIFGQLSMLPDFVIQIAVTISSLFSNFLSFIIPLMIIGFVVIGIADLAQGAGKLLGVTTLIAYSSTLLGGFAAYFVATHLFPLFINSDLSTAIQGSAPGLEPLFTIPLEPMLDVTSAIVFSFMFGISISWLRSQNKGETMYHLFGEFNLIITKVLSTVVIPGLPFYIFGNFANLSYAGSVFTILSVFWKVFASVIAMQLTAVALFFIIAGLYAKKNPFTLMKNQVPGYVTAIGTQSSAATIPVNLEVAKKNGVSAQIREFVIPLGATIHLLGSIITIISCVTAVLLMYDLPHQFGMIAGFVAMLGIAMVAAPGAPGGGIMSALPFLTMVGIDPTGTIGNLLVTLYLTQDSFGTAANISGDNAIAVIIDKIYHKYILQKNDSVSVSVENES